MEKNDAPLRRVGTLTFGLVLVICGGLMLVSLFFPALDWALCLKASPLILISLGVETLLAARGGSRIRYDWVGMLLCLVLTSAALCLYGAAWYLTWAVPNGICL